MSELKVFIGYDGREKIAYEVLKHSIEKRTKTPHKIIPLYHKELRRQGFFHRPWMTNAMDGNFTDLIDNKPFSTEFSHSRFLVPALMKFNGWALFVDCDMIFKCDLKEIFEHCDDRYAVMCVKHNQKVTKQEKMDGSAQQSYYRKNWSSFVLFNCGHKLNRELTTERVNTATGGWLHSFAWLPDEAIGALPQYYNWIEGTSPHIERPRVIHYTMGGPWFSSYKEVMYADDWWNLYKSFHEYLPEPSDELLKVDYRSL
jgi:lipopolysaccharide biosynthesis glycosyltransferase